MNLLFLLVALTVTAIMIVVSWLEKDYGVERERAARRYKSGVYTDFLESVSTSEFHVEGGWISIDKQYSRLTFYDIPEMKGKILSDDFHRLDSHVSGVDISRGHVESDAVTVPEIIGKVA